MGMGTLNKLVLHFPRVFWDQIDFLGHAGKDRRKWLLFMDMSRVSNRPILVAMSGGPFAVLMERLGDAEITRRAMDVIRTVYPGAPDPVSSQATRWKTSKFSRGSFSFIPPGCRSVFVPARGIIYEYCEFMGSRVRYCNTWRTRNRTIPGRCATLNCITCCPLLFVHTQC